MRPGQQNKRMRGRGRRGPNPLSRSYESNGPDVKVRGTAAHIAEKYMQLARDAHASGDPVMAESYLQHAEHYFRIIAAAQAQSQQGADAQPQQRYNGGGRYDSADDESEDVGEQAGAESEPRRDSHARQPDVQPAAEAAADQPRQEQGEQPEQPPAPRRRRRRSADDQAAAGNGAEKPAARREKSAASAAEPAADEGGPQSETTAESAGA